MQKTRQLPGDYGQKIPRGHPTPSLTPPSFENQKVNFKPTYDVIDNAHSESILALHEMRQ